MATMQDLRADEVANLKGKMHPLYKGVLRIAVENDLRELTVRVLQFPDKENGNLAVCQATAVFGSGSERRVFTEVGDCDDANCGTMIRPHKVRMAATRAKGRALRDALGIGEALAEEIHASEPDRLQPGDPEVIPSQCQVCGADVPGEELGSSRYRFKGIYCSKHRQELAAAQAKPAEHFCADCGVQIEGVETKKGPVSVDTIVTLSQQRFGKKLCHACGRKLMETENVNLPSAAVAA